MERPHNPTGVLKIRPNKDRYNQELARLVDHHKAMDVFDTARKMKEEGVKPNAQTYAHLLRACADIAVQAEAWAVFEDMIAVGLTPTRNTFHHLLSVR